MCYMNVTQMKQENSYLVQDRSNAELWTSKTKIRKLKLAAGVVSDEHKPLPQCCV